MVNLFDIMRQAQNGSGLQNVGRVFGLDGDQSLRAVEALLPAFALAFRHATRNPDAFAQLIEMMGSARYLPFFDRGFGGTVSGPNGAAPVGAEIVAKLFGPDEASRRVADQASALTGIATGVLHQMMPVLAAVVMGGLVRSLSVEGLSDTLRAWADWLAGLKQPERAAGADLGPFYAMWQSSVAAMMGVAPARAAPPPPADPWSGMLQAMFGAARPAPPPPPPSPFEALSKMFDTGREVQAKYLAGLQAAMGGAGGRS